MVSAEIVFHASNSNCHYAQCPHGGFLVVWGVGGGRQCQAHRNLWFWASKYRTTTPEPSKKRETFLTLWQGALSHWKTNACPSIKYPCRGKYVISEHSYVLLLPHGTSHQLSWMAPHPHMPPGPPGSHLHA